MKKSYKIPISVKGIVFENRGVWLRKNERKEWELPGGKVDKGEQPERAVVREIKEELGFKVEVEKIVRAYIYKVKSSPDEKEGVLVISYLCKLLKKDGKFELKGEAGPAEFKKISINKIPDLFMPAFYKEVIIRAWKMK